MRSEAHIARKNVCDYHRQNPDAINTMLNRPINLVMIGCFLVLARPTVGAGAKAM